MTLRVLRYRLAITDEQTVIMPQPANVLSVAVSREDPNGLIDLWAIGGDGYRPVEVPIFVHGTGHPMIDAPSAFVGTVVTPNQLVWHVFRGANRP